MLVIGLMSGTSLDGVDAALVEFGEDGAEDVGGEGGRAGAQGVGSGAESDGSDAAAASAGAAPRAMVEHTGVPPRWSLRAFVTIPYTGEQRERIHRAIVSGGAAELCRLHADLGEWLASAALAVCEAAGVVPGEVALIGSHGQTVWHEPPREGMRGATLQLGCPATIAERTGIPVVSDFRTRDMAAGGEGAPLVPWVDRLLFSVPGRRRILLNIGGMANLTWLPALGEAEPVLAFDTGPGNALIDAAVELATGGAEVYDRGGAMAARGRVDDVVLADLLAHPYFGRVPPKSTGREVFGRPYVERLVTRLAPADEQDWCDLVATLTALTARSIAGAIGEWVAARGVDEVVVTGGGAHNPELCRMLAEALAPVPLRPGKVLGLDPDAKEAVAFAVLAWAHSSGEPANIPEVTGAVGPRILGSYTPGRASR